MAKVEREYEDLRGDGKIVLFLREGKKPRYYVRLKHYKVPGYLVRTTGTNVRNDAVRIALDMYDEFFQHVKAGGSAKSPTFKTVYNAWKKSKENAYGKTRSKDRAVEYVATYALHYFGNNRLDSLTSKDFSAYWDYRRNNYKRKLPTPSTLNRERTAIISMFKFALKHGYITKMAEIEKQAIKSISRRPTFTTQEWQTIYTKMRSWVNEGKATGHWRERFLLQQYVLIMANSGLRVGEARNISWGNFNKVEVNDSISTLMAEEIIEDTEENISSDEEIKDYDVVNPHLVTVTVFGKTGKRVVVLNSSCKDYLQRIYNLRTEELGNQAPALDEPVFLNIKTGKPIHSFKKSFAAMLTYCKVPISDGELNRTIYSLRHYYATAKLNYGQNHYFLAANMGTSVEMIEKHYGHLTVRDIAKSVDNTTKSFMRKNLTKKFTFFN